mgnify:CR=1 FL=1
MENITSSQFALGTIISKFNVPKDMVEEINLSYDQAKNLTPHNDHLAGKIANEFDVKNILSKKVNNFFLLCFKDYLKQICKDLWHIELHAVWINDMKENEYNPFHYHTGPTDLGLSSVLFLKKPKSYGIEYSNPNTPANGRLEFGGGQQDPLSISQLRVDADVGELFIFPYTLLHGVYPFNGTNETRRTMSYNCSLHAPEYIKSIPFKILKSYVDAVSKKEVENVKILNNKD